MLLAAIAGALIGDGSAFWVGHRSQREILSTWPLTKYPRVIAQSEAFFQRWGSWAVFFARFVPPIRAFVPVTAGALGMTPMQFFATNIPAVLLWAPAHVLPGVVAVSALHRYGGIPHHVGLKPLLDGGRHWWRHDRCACDLGGPPPPDQRRGAGRRAGERSELSHSRANWSGTT